MLLLPAIDLMGGEVVRLKRGLAEQKTVYSSDPVTFARKWEEAGADWLHLVDLDAAFSGEPRNLRHKAHLRRSEIPCELGGGMRNVRNITAPSPRASPGYSWNEGLRVHGFRPAGVRRIRGGPHRCGN